MEELYDKYTRSLYNLINIDELDIWSDIDFNLPSLVDTTLIKSMFYARYEFEEIALETVSLWLDYLRNKVVLLARKYTPLFSAFYDEYTDEDIYKNSDVSENTTQKRYATPQTQISDVSNYLTEQYENLVTTGSLVGQTKAEARDTYVKKLRDIYYEYIEEFRNLFMGVY